jgi:cation diffusion facilitator family transporter
MGVNVLLVAGKLAGGFFGHSHALVADAMESLADIFSSLIVWRAVVLAAEPPDREHPYGHGKAEAIATAVVSTILLLAALGIAINAGRQLFAPRDPPRAFTLYILLGVVLVKELVFRYASRQARLAESGAVKADAWHHRSDAITSLAEAIGISVCLAGGPVYADDAAALFAAGIIGWNGWVLLRPALDELMDAAPSAGLLAQIRATAA